AFTSIRRRSRLRLRFRFRLLLRFLLLVAAALAAIVLRPAVLRAGGGGEGADIAAQRVDVLARHQDALAFVADDRLARAVRSRLDRAGEDVDHGGVAAVDMDQELGAADADGGHRRAQ